MRAWIGAPWLALLIVGCTPVGEQWPSDEELDRRWVEPMVPTIPPTGAPPIVPPDACAGAPPAPTDPLHPALGLDLRYDGPPALEPGMPLPLAARLRNRSSSSSYQAVLPGDGSEVAWREPHVWYSAFVDSGDGCWRPVPELTVGRCGMFDHEWQDDVVRLSPGATQDLEWIGNPSYMLDLQRPGRVRLYMHYAYREGETGKGGTPEEIDVGAMDGIEAFELVSNPIELTLVRPLELVLTARPRAPGRAVSRVDDVVELRLRNVGEETREVVPPSSSTLSFEVKGSEDSWPSASWRPEDDEQAARPIAVGDELALLGATSLAPALRYEWHHQLAEVVRVRAVYRPYADRRNVALRSAWVEVDLR